MLVSAPLCRHATADLHVTEPPAPRILQLRDAIALEFSPRRRARAARSRINEDEGDACTYMRMDSPRARAEVTSPGLGYLTPKTRSCTETTPYDPPRPPPRHHLNQPQAYRACAWRARSTEGDRRRPEATGGDRRRPEATGGDRRRPEATGDEARVKQRPCLFRSTTKTTNPLLPDSHSNGAGWRSWRRISCRRPPATHSTAASTHSEKESQRRRRREAQHRREGSRQMRTQSATNDDDNSSIAPKEYKRRPGETRSVQPVT